LKLVGDKGLEPLTSSL